MKKTEFLWTEKYRPQRIQDYVFKDARQKKTIAGWIADKNIPHVLFHGPAGTGKSSIVNVLLNELEIDKGDILYVNASEDRNVDMIRSRVLTFVQTIGFGDYKVVLLEECLHEDEKIQTPNGVIRLGDLSIGEKIDVLSFNMETGEIEADTAEVIIDREQDVFEVELEDGRTIKTTLDHPFLIKDQNGIVVEKPLRELNPGDKIIDT